MFLILVVLHRNCRIVTKATVSEGFRTRGLHCRKTFLCQGQNHQDLCMIWNDFWQEDAVQTIHIGIEREGT
jgi:hypothetical protein